VALFPGCAFATGTNATPAPIFNVDFASGGIVPNLEAYQANSWTRTVRLTVGLSPYSLTNCTPYFWYGVSNSTLVTTAECTIVNATNGTFTAHFTPDNLNTNGNFLFGVGVPGPSTAKIGNFKIIPDQYAVGAGAISYVTPLNWALYSYIGMGYAPFVFDAAGFTITTNANGGYSVSAKGGAGTTYTFVNTNLAAGVVVTNGSAVFIGTNIAASSESDPVWSAASNSYLRTSATNSLASTGYVAGVVAGYVPTNDATYTATVAQAASAVQPAAISGFATITNTGYGVTNYGTALYPLFGLTEGYVSTNGGMMEAMATLAWAESGTYIDGVSIMTFSGSFDGYVSAGYYLGNGSNLTGITASQIGASTTGHVHAADAVTNLQSTVAGYGYTTASTVTGIAQSVVAPWTNQVTSAAIAGAGGVTGTPWYVSTAVPSNITASIESSTCTVTAAMGPYLFLAPTSAVTITADTTLTSNLVVAGFSLDLFTTGQVTWITTAITNTTTLSTTATNSILFWKGYGGSILIGR
jgi:hypothetical protein